ncbi:MAG: hypothetical protein HY363_02275 [Candidatus Aenigmarchaeota archaeon]|nr:hypothetical protein [Candidatus Aenigmarchaeota archaeon]
MSLMDKLFFWRHLPDEFEMPKDFDIPPEPISSPAGYPSGLPSLEKPETFRPEQSFGVQPVSSSLQQGAQTLNDKDLQLILAKLDAIKAGIETINARLDKLERKEEVKWR